MDVFVGGGGIGELVEQALLHPECRQVFRWGQSIGYIRPMVQRILEANQAGDRGQRIRAIVIYPMSALCNSQFKELEEEFCFGHPKGGERDSVANDTGQGKEAEREAIQTNPPDILLTNAARPAPGGRPPRRQMGALPAAGVSQNRRGRLRTLNAGLRCARCWSFCWRRSMPQPG